MKSEEQYRPIGFCDCGHELMIINGKVKWHDCPDNLDAMEDTIHRIKLSGLKINEMSNVIMRKTAKEVIDDYLRSN